MARSIERYLRLLPKTSGVRYTERVWYPSADVYRTRDGGWIVKVELAGVSPDEIEISVERDAMRITGSRRDLSCSECVSFQQLEIVYSSFEKAIRFPCSIEGAEIETLYDAGLLIISVKTRAEECG